jgi:multiple sugar transport system ATP-binding protein
MLGGQLLQVAPPAEIYAEPADRRVAEFVGSPRINILAATVRDDGAVEAGGAVLMPPQRLAPRTRLALGIRPEALILVDADGPGVMRGRVRLLEHLGADLYAHLEVPGCPEPVILRASVEQAGRLAPGAAVYAACMPGRGLLFDADGSRLGVAAPPSAGGQMVRAVA